MLPFVRCGRLGAYPQAGGTKGGVVALSGGYVLGGSSRRRPSTVLVGARWARGFGWRSVKEGFAEGQGTLRIDFRVGQSYDGTPLPVPPGGTSAAILARTDNVLDR